MSRFPTVHDVVGNAVLAAEVGDAIHLVASRLAGSAWWNDSENDRPPLSGNRWLTVACLSGG
jgi:hypothetical protein